MYYYEKSLPTEFKKNIRACLETLSVFRGGVATTLARFNLESHLGALCPPMPRLEQQHGREPYVNQR